MSDQFDLESDDLDLPIKDTIMRYSTVDSISARPSRPPANSGGMWKFYTDDSPGFKVGPVPVLVMRVIFIFSVFVLPMYVKLTRG